MTAGLIILLALAVCLALPPSGAAGSRAREALAGPHARGLPAPHAGRKVLNAVRFGRASGRAAEPVTVPMTEVVQQVAALLKGGRTTARLWDELWLLYSGGASQGLAADEDAGARTGRGHWHRHGPGHGLGHGPSLARESQVMLTAVRAATLAGLPAAGAIRGAGLAAGAGKGRGAGGAGELRVWGELAACFDIAEASGCPLADVLARFAAQLEADDDAEAVRQTALAGPRATVRLLTWLPLFGLGLGLLMGVDPTKILVGTPFGMGALAAGLILTTAGRIWSSRLVRAAAGAHP